MFVFPARFLTKLLILSLAVLLVSASCSRDGAEKERRPEDRAVEEETGVDVVLEGMDGSKSRLSDFRRRVVLLSFWATWNNDSRELIGIMNVLQKKYRDRVVIVGVAMDRGAPAAVRRFAEKNEIEYPVFINGEQVSRSFGGVGELPTSLIILPDGRVFERIAGLKRRQYYEDRMTKLLRHL